MVTVSALGFKKAGDGRQAYLRVILLNQRLMQLLRVNLYIGFTGSVTMPPVLNI